MIQVGRVMSIVDNTVVIESLRSMPPLDLDTVLFKDGGEPIGSVSDVFGSVHEPYYSVKFPTPQDISERAIEKETPVYFLPQADRDVTKFAFVDVLKKVKGSDASWENDNEPPEGLMDYSDDEEEARAKKDQRIRKIEAQQSSTTQQPTI